MSKRVINNSYHFGKHVVKFKSLSKCHVIATKDDYESKKIISYDILDSDNITLARVQCSVKYIIVLFIETKNGYIYNKKTDTKEEFTFDEFNINDYNGEVLSDWTAFRLSDYNRDNKMYHFDYNDNGSVKIIESVVGDQMIDTTLYEYATEKDMPIKLMEGIFMHQNGGLIYA